MNTKLDVTLTTNLQALVPLVFLTSKSWDEKYASYPYRKLRGPHPVDMSEHIPDNPIEDITICHNATVDHIHDPH